MNTQARTKLTAWLRRPRGSLGWVAAIVFFMTSASLYRAFQPASLLTIHEPLVLLSLAVFSAIVGLAVQRRFTRSVGETIFANGSSGWQRKLTLLNAAARESNVLLGTLVLLALLGTSILWLAGRSVEHIVNACEANLQAQIDTPNGGPLVAMIAKPVCQCLAQVFLDRNGVIRLALFDTSVLEVTAFKGVTETDEQRCLEQLDLLPEEPTAMIVPQASDKR